MDARRPFAALALSILLAGCGVPADGPIPRGSAAAARRGSAASTRPRTFDPATVSGNIELLTGSSPVEATITRRLVRGFHRLHPRITVRFVAINRDYPTVVLTRFAGGAAPDVFIVDGKFFADWATKGLLLPLDGYVAGQQVDLRRYRKPLLDSVRRGPGGRTYALPTNYSTVALFTNDAMLADAGIARPPRTTAELEVDARKLTVNGGRGATGRFGLCIIPRWERMLLFALQRNGGITNAAGTKMKVTSAGTRSAVEWVRTMLRTRAAASPDAVGASWCGDGFGKGRFAMALEGAWMLPPMRHQFPGVRYTISPLPVGERPATLAYSGNVAIASSTKHPDAAWMLLDYLASPGAQAQLARSGVGVPALTGVPYPPELDTFAHGIDYATVWALPPGFFNSVLITADNEMSAVLEGKQTVDGMLRKVDEVGRTMLQGAAP